MFSKKTIEYQQLIDFCFEILNKNGFPPDRSLEIVTVLVEADVRGIPSHGVARLKRYIKEKEMKFILPNASPKIFYETSNSLVIDGMKGPGQSVSVYAMNKCIEKAKTNMICLCSVRNSNHYGISAYYSEMPLAHNMIGIAMTNSYPLVVPTFGKEAVLGTNPFSICIPGMQHPFELDMATSIVTRGKIETYQRHEKKLPIGWAIDEAGYPTDNPERVLNNFNMRNFGGLLPLGGEGELLGGHKGFGLALLVDLLTAGLSNGAWSGETYRDKDPGVCHFFAAIKLELFGAQQTIKQKIQYILDEIIKSEKIHGKSKIYYHGEKEFTTKEKYLEKGIPIFEKTVVELCELADKSGVQIPKRFQ